MSVVLVLLVPPDHGDVPMVPLESRVYMTTEHAAQYLDFPTVNAFRCWASSRKVRRCDGGRRYRRKDLDRAVIDHPADRFASGAA